jgi:serine/threonine-protein kinase
LETEFLFPVRFSARIGSQAKAVVTLPREEHRPPMSLLQEGQWVRDTYEVERFLGQGAFAEVYRVRHRLQGRQALKIFKLIGMTRDEVQELLGEALVLSRLGHPNIIRPFEADSVEVRGGTCGFFTMEYVPGGSLAQFCRLPGPKLLPVPTTVDLIRQVCAGLSVAHAEQPPIVHRDIKPDNLLVSPEGQGWRVRIGDFGLAQRVSRLTGVTAAQGDLAFKPPEAHFGLGTDSCAGDVWAVGSTLYLLLTKQFPYPEPGGRDALRRRRFERLTPAHVLNEQVDPELESIVARALAPDAGDRYGDAGAFLANLCRWQQLHGGASCRTPAAPPVSATAEEEARRLVVQAVQCARQAVQLARAADLLEEACRRWPPLHAEYAEQIKLWRRGIAF